MPPTERDYLLRTDDQLVFPVITGRIAPDKPAHTDGRKQEESKHYQSPDKITTAQQPDHRNSMNHILPLYPPLSLPSKDLLLQTNAFHPFLLLFEHLFPSQSINVLQ